jgi:hypothetical protein
VVETVRHRGDSQKVLEREEGEDAQEELVGERGEQVAAGLWWDGWI